MSKYTTGEIAKLCGVTVRTVQYYDTRGILVPTELSEGGRRLYSENDLSRMRVICFLRDLGLPIATISQILQEENSGKVIDLLLEQQEADLEKEVQANQEKLDKTRNLRHELKKTKTISVESLGDIAITMTNRQKLKKVHMTMLLTGIPLTLLEVAAIVIGIAKDWWWGLFIWGILAIPWGILLSRYYFKNVAYICPECHTDFKPKMRDAFWANHTPSTRKLTCPHCGHRGFCVEVAADQSTGTGTSVSHTVTQAHLTDRDRA